MKLPPLQLPFDRWRWGLSRRRRSGSQRITVVSSSIGTRSFCPDLFDSRLLDKLLDRCGSASFAEDQVDRIGTREIEAPQIVGPTINVLLNRAPLLRWVEAATGCGPLDRVEGRLVQTRANGTDGLDWHADTFDPLRRLAMTIDLSPARFEGGHFELRDARSREILFAHRHDRSGCAVIFDVAGGLEHRVLPVGGGGPRRVFTGWFMAPSLVKGGPTSLPWHWRLKLSIRKTMPAPARPGSGARQHRDGSGAACRTPPHVSRLRKSSPSARDAGAGRPSSAAGTADARRPPGAPVARPPRNRRATTSPPAETGAIHYRPWAVPAISRARRRQGYSLEGIDAGSGFAVKSDDRASRGQPGRLAGYMHHRQIVANQPCTQPEHCGREARFPHPGAAGDQQPVTPDFDRGSVKWQGPAQCGVESSHRAVECRRHPTCPARAREIVDAAPIGQVENCLVPPFEAGAVRIHLTVRHLTPAKAIG